MFPCRKVHRRAAAACGAKGFVRLTGPGWYCTRRQPMAATFPPRRESELVPFSVNFKTKIAATPTVFGLTAGQATSYGTKHDAFVSAWDVCQDPMTKSKGNVALKNAAKAALIDELRLLAGIVQRAPGT